MAIESKIIPWRRLIRVTLGPLEEWRGLVAGEIVQFESDGTREGLRVVCAVNRSIMGMPNPSTITIYNLAQDTRNALRRGMTKITVEAGWRGRLSENEDGQRKIEVGQPELYKVFQGSLVSAMHERTGADIVTKISALPGYGGYLRGISSKSYAPNMPVKDVVKDLGKDMPGLTVPDANLEGINGTIGSQGWSFCGSTQDGMTKLAENHGFSWHIDNGQVKAVGDGATFGGLVELNGRNGGLMNITPTLEGPMQIRTGVKVKSIYIPGVTVGSSIKVNSEMNPDLNGTYRIHTCSINIDAYADEWTMDIESKRFGVLI